MKFLALALALLLEQAWPLRRGNPFYAAFERYADILEQRFNGLQANHGAIAWMVAVLPLALLTALIYALLREAHLLLALAWSIAVLYIAMGFRRFSHCFTEIAQALTCSAAGAACPQTNSMPRKFRGWRSNSGCCRRTVMCWVRFSGS